MPDRHSRRPTASGLVGRVRWSYLAIAVATVGVLVWVHANRGRAQQNLAALCTEEYAKARTAADTAAIDRRIIVPTSRRSTTGVTCRQYRHGSS